MSSWTLQTRRRSHRILPLHTESTDAKRTSTAPRHHDSRTSQSLRSFPNTDGRNNSLTSFDRLSPEDDSLKRSKKARSKRISRYLVGCFSLLVILGKFTTNFRGQSSTQDVHFTSTHGSVKASPDAVFSVNGTSSYKLDTLPLIPEDHHRHKVPNIIIFTHYRDFLHEDLPYSMPNVSATHHQRTHNLTEDQIELLALQANVRASASLHPKAQVRFLTDNDCIESLSHLLDSAEDNADLVAYFRRESIGMFKADLCRGAALYETGGLYFDVDLGVRQNVFEVLKETTRFATVLVHSASNHKGSFFQAFIASTPQHFVLKRYIELFLSYARHELDIDGPLGVILLQRAYNEMVEERPDIVDTTELWQEVMYRPGFQTNILSDVPPPTWGYRRACKFIVLANKALPLRVPFYSRIAGSRMCPFGFDSRYKTKPKTKKIGKKAKTTTSESDDNQHHFERINRKFAAGSEKQFDELWMNQSNFRAENSAFVEEDE
jgi:hypothetical protein